MADESAIKRAALLRHFLGLFGKEKDAALEAGACREACHALTSQQLLRETQLMHASSHARGQLAQSVEAWCSSLGKLLQKAQPSPLVAMLLSTTIQTCDADRLLQVHGAWGTALADILKKCSTSLTPQGAATPQPSSAAALVVAVSAALRHLFTRLHEFLDVGGIRRDASALASRTAGIVTPMLAAALQPNVNAGPVCVSLLRLVTALLRTLPTALRHHAPGLEQALAAIVAAPTRSSSSSSSGAGSGAGSGWSRSGGLGGKSGGKGGGKGSEAELRERAAHCLCLLPRAQGDAHSHSNTFRRLLLSLHDAMDGAFMGLDDPAAAAAAREALGSSSSIVAGSGGGSSGKSAAADASASGPLIPQALLLHGSSTTAALPAAAAGSGRGGGGGGGSRTASGDAVRRLLEVVGALLVGVEVLLVEPFPVPVPLPSAALLSALSRLLSFNEGAQLAAGRVPPSASGFARLSAGLPSLQATGWALLGLMLRVCGCSLLPLLPTIARVLADLLRRVCVLGPAGLAAHPPAVRAAAYHAARAACEARGVGAVRLLGDACMGAVSVELYGWAVQAEGGAGGQAHHMGGTSGRSGGGSSKHAAKRAKLMGAAEAVESAEAAAAAAAAAAGASTCMAVGSDELEAQLGAVQLMEALACAGGPLLHATTRAQLDAMSFHVAASSTAAAHRLAQGHPRSAAAANAAATPTAASGINPQQGTSAKSGAAASAAAASGSAASAAVTAGLASLRAAALRALLASLLAPCSPGSRPPFLSQALQLFQEGAAGGGGAFHPEVAAVCRGAGTQMEALLHPRALPISVAQPSAYAGLQELAPLPRPRMWTVLDPTPALALRTGPVLSNGPPPLGHAPAAHTSAAAAAAAGGGAAAGAGGPSGDAHEKHGLLDPVVGQALRVSSVQNLHQEQPVSLATTEAFRQARGALTGVEHGGEQGVGLRAVAVLGSAENAEGGEKGDKQEEPAPGRGERGRSDNGGQGGKDAGSARMGWDERQPQQQQQTEASEEEEEKEGGEGKQREGLPHLQGKQTQGRGGQALAHHAPELQAPIAAGSEAKVAGGGLAGESSDSEGSLPNIDSGGEQDSSDDDDSDGDDDEMEG